MSIAVEPDTDAALRAVEERVLWLATAIVDHANRVRPNPDGLKVEVVSGASPPAAVTLKASRIPFSKMLTSLSGMPP